MNAILRSSPPGDLKRLAHRLLISTVLFAVVLIIGVQLAHAAAIVPSVVPIESIAGWVAPPG